MREPESGNGISKLLDELRSLDQELVRRYETLMRDLESASRDGRLPATIQGFVSDARFDLLRVSTRLHLIEAVPTERTEAAQPTERAKEVSPRLTSYRRPAVPADGAYDVLTWIALAAASGVTGNVAYDLVKTAFRRKSKSSIAGRGTSDPDDNWLLAKLAVQARFGELKLRVPRFEDLTELGYEWATNGESTYRLQVAGLEAKVKVPAGALEGARIDVTLYGPRDDLPPDLTFD